MRVPLVVGFALVSIGCDRLFALDEVSYTAGSGAGDGGAGDGDTLPTDAPADAVFTACSNPSADIELPLRADTWLGSPAQGDSGGLYGGGGSHILVTFDTLGYRIASATLTLRAAISSPVCDPSFANNCYTCPRSDGNYDVYLSRTDWDEDHATNNLRTATASWDMLNATGGSERTAPVTETFSTSTNQLVHTRVFPPGFTSPFGDVDRLGFHIEAAGGSAVFFAKENTITCTDVPDAPALVIRCR